MSVLTQAEEGLFLIYRTSKTEPPCKGAFAVRYLEKQTQREPLTYLPGNRKRWESCGKNHRIETIDGEELMVREFLEIKPGWAIRFPDLTALLQFTKIHEECILRIKETGVAEIEIYDTYRE